uniref:GRF-type domain-containing protein n=1 Tax=Chenopodium quinoa TaxID=63459 RepID=A0A803MRN3_CHEQI
MNNRREIGSASNSSRSFGSAYPKIKCRCGVEAIIRTVRNGDNAGMKFYGCSNGLRVIVDSFSGLMLTLRT